MWLPKSGSSLHGGGGGGDRLQRKGTAMVAVAIDKDKNSQHALKWTIEHLVTRGQTIVLIHVIRKPSAAGNYSVQCLDVILEDTSISKALTEYASYAAIEFLVLGASSKHGFLRFRSSDVPSHVMKAAPDFCTIYVISKGKISSAKKSSRSAPFPSPLREKIQQQSNHSFEASIRRKNSFNMQSLSFIIPVKLRSKFLKILCSVHDTTNLGRGLNPKLLCGELSESDTDISFVSSGRPSSDRMSSALRYDISSLDLSPTPRLSTSSDHSFGSMYYGTKGSDFGAMFSSSSIDSKRPSSARSGVIHIPSYAIRNFKTFATKRLSLKLNQDEVDDEMRRLKNELQRTMEMYSTACKDALTAKQKRLDDVRVAEEEAREIADKEKKRYQALMAKARASRRIAEIESEKRGLEQSEEKPTESNNVNLNQFKYRRYTIDEIEEATEFFTEARKIGEGGYGPVFKGRLDHTLVAIKVLRPDAAQGRSQFQQEVEVLSCMRHPNMVLLLGACPEYGCLVYEYMANGSLEDRLLRRGNTPPLPWQIRFKISAEIATGILFLHQTKPEPIVHRDLKPGNILLDQNLVSKISDVGLARLLPASLTEDVTQYRMTSAAGTMCYIDPEYQQTGMLGVKSDVYSLGIMLLQLITAKPAMGLAHQVRRAINKGTFAEMLDPTVSDWPIDEALGFAKLSIQCAELRRKDRPDLGKVVLPELCRLRDLGEESMPSISAFGTGPCPSHSQTSIPLVSKASYPFRS
ncbi:Concanavalin A-like lectin/glucanase, subgroup [Cynara cardunculus var. scolymus]|uniref:RING-type E3 ubiquitin transferase n=1 Tax=Cynara cardunculus var. scolymus TaxID=59895 RepID=A0A103Y9R2_CYNCS|nr:Concanavalin A-like lectin/glucanase, subgroup [Cynara cardunculus var. scolymus]